MVLLPLLISSSSAIVFEAAKMGYNGRIKREKKSPAFMYPLNGMKQDCINYQKFINNICCSQYQFSCLYIA